MKNEIILWLSSLIIVFIIGYIKNVTDINYPITGTFGIEGKKVSYKLDKVSFDKHSYKNIIISDIKGITAKVLMIKDDEQTEIPYKEIARGLEVEIPKLKPGQMARYKVIIIHKDQVIEIPKNDFVALTFWGDIPTPVSFLNFILIYSGLIMSIRCSLESLIKKSNLKKFAVINCTIFITLITIIHPLYTSYKLGAINHYVPPFSDLVNPLLLIILIMWIFGTILIFNKKSPEIVTIVVSTATVLIYFLI
jgi:hypothetical protein